MAKTFKRKAHMPLSKKQTKAVKTIAMKAVEKKAEVKVFESGALTALTNISSTATGNLIVDMPQQGTDAFQRVGDKIDLLSLQIRADFDCGTATATHGRIMLVQSLDSDKDGDLQLRDVLQYVQPGNKTTSYYKHNSDRKFKVLSDKQYYWDSNTVSAPQPYFVDLKNFGYKTIVLDDGGNDTGNIGEIYMWAIGGSGATDMDVRSFEYRYRYTDT